MAFLPYSEIVKVIDAIARRLQEDQEFLITEIYGSDTPFKATAFTSPDAFVVFRSTQPERPEDWTQIQIAGGGGLNAPPDPGLFRHLLLRSNSFDWGGPFATVRPDGTVTYGSQVTISSSLVSWEDPRDAIHFMMDMVRVMGQASRLLANEALPQFGGALLDGSDPRHDTVLLAAMMGPMPRDLEDELR